MGERRDIPPSLQQASALGFIEAMYEARSRIYDTPASLRELYATSKITLARLEERITEVLRRG